MNQGEVFAKVWDEADGVHIDVRGLAAPEPLTQIMRLVLEVAQAQRDAATGTTTPAAGAVIVHHDRDPVMLYPELLEMGWWAERIDGDPGEVRLRLAPTSA